MWVCRGPFTFRTHLSRPSEVPTRLLIRVWLRDVLRSVLAASVFKSS